MSNSNSLLERLRKTSKLEGVDSIADSKVLGNFTFTKTEVPMINVAFSGDLDGGLSSGVTVIAGPSKHFKTNFALLAAAAYLKENPDSICAFYDSEFGSPKAYFESHGIDVNRVLHLPITNIEQLKFDLVAQLQEIKRGDKVVIVIDSVGNLASKKEVEDAINEKSVADMTRAKALKGLFRMVTPFLKLKDLPLVVVNHTYQTQEMYSKAIVSGGTGIYYSSDTIWIIGRQQDKDGDELKGYHFVINIEKSRFIKEKSKIPITVSWAGGIERYSGLLDVALEGGFIIKPVQGWYIAIDPKTKKELSKKVRADETLNAEFWDPIFKETDFKSYVKERFSVGHVSMLSAPTEIDTDE